MRAADRAGIGLSVETPVERIVVFRLAGWTHGKDAHGRLISVVGDILHNREARPTVGAVDERIAVAAVGWIKQFARTVRANRNIRGNQCVDFFTGGAVNDPEIGIAVACDVAHNAAGDARQRGRFDRQTLHKIFNSFRGPFHFNGHACGSVANISAQFPAGCQALHIRPESDSLHDACYFDLPPYLHTD